MTEARKKEIEEIIKRFQHQAKVLSAINDEGIDVIDAAKMFFVPEKTIRGWMKRQAKREKSGSVEIERLRREQRELLIRLGELVWSGLMR